MQSFFFRSKIPKVLTLLNIFIGVAVIVFILLLIREAVTGKYMGFKKDALTPPSMSKKEGAGPGKIAFYEYETILTNNPFGFPAGRLRELSGSTEVNVRKPELMLIGTISGPEIYSFAVFSDKSGKQEIFRVGDMISGLGRLREVRKDRVVLSEGGRREEVLLSDIVKVTDISPVQPEQRESGLARNVGERSFVVDQRKILNAIENPNKLMTEARLQPNLVDGKQNGFVLREVRNNGIYQSLGLRNGDVLLRINDYNINNVDSALQAFSALRGMERVNLDILRNGEKVTLTYLLNEGQIK